MKSSDMNQSEYEIKHKNVLIFKICGLSSFIKSLLVQK